MKNKKSEKKDLNNFDDWEIVENESMTKEEEKGGTIFDEFLSSADWDNKDENEYKNKVLNEKWIKESPYFDLEKFSKNISSFHYFDYHCSKLESKCQEKNYINILSQPNFFSNPNTKKFIRQGVPPKYMHDVLLALFDIKETNEVNYNKFYSMIFKEHDVKNLGDYVPYYTGKKTLKESLPFHYLNETGILELKILLWMINEIYRNVIIFCPIFIRLISLILIFCNKYETLEIICRLIEKEKNDKGILEIKRRLQFTQSDNIIIIESIESCINDVPHKKRSTYYEIFQKIKFKKTEVYKDMYYNFFFNYINFYGLIRLLPLFLKDGFKSIYRLICALENGILEKGISLKKKEVIKRISDKTKKMDVDEIFNDSLNYQFKIIKNEENNEGNSEENNEFYLPTYKGGNLLTDYEIIHLWELFPTEYKIKNATIIYQASKDGYNLPNILELEQKYNKNTAILFLIGTSEGDKFGFIISNLLTHTDNEYQRPNSSFLFTITPEFKIYSPDVDSDEILYITNTDFIFGNGPKGPAIQLNQDIRKGISYEGGCFNNPCLVKDPDGHFCVVNLEIFKLE